MTAQRPTPEEEAEANELARCTLLLATASVSARMGAPSSLLRVAYHLCQAERARCWTRESYPWRDLQEAVRGVVGALT